MSENYVLNANCRFTTKNFRLILASTKDFPNLVSSLSTGYPVYSLLQTARAENRLEVLVIFLTRSLQVCMLKI